MSFDSQCEKKTCYIIEKFGATGLARQIECLQHLAEQKVNQGDDALVLVNSAIDLITKESEITKIYRKRCKINSALEEWIKAFKKFENTEESHGYLLYMEGIVFLKDLNYLREALRWTHAANIRFGENFEILKMGAQLSYRLKHYEDCIRWLNDALNIKKTAALVYNRANVYKLLDKREEAWIDVNEALEINPKYRMAIKLKKTLKKAREKSLPKNNFELKYSTQNEIACGSFGKVILGITRENGEKVAIKIVRKKPQSSLISNEVIALEELDHDNIVTLHEVLEIRKKLYIVQEYLSGGDLVSYVKDYTKHHPKSNLPERQIIPILHQLLGAVQYMHQKFIIHRDLKAENVMFCSANHKKVKIIDFGTAIKIDSYAQEMYDQVGTPFYKAPEMLVYKTYDYKVDIWAIGVIMFILLHNAFPFQESDSYRRNLKITNRSLSHTGKNLLKELLAPDPKKRLTVEEALNHEWF